MKRSRVYEDGNNVHTATEIGVDTFRADRSPKRMSRTTALGELWIHTKGGIHLDGRFETLRDVIEYCDGLL